jgi:hypothetical protein
MFHMSFTRRDIEHHLCVIFRLAECLFMDFRLVSYLFVDTFLPFKVMFVEKII